MAILNTANLTSKISGKEGEFVQVENKSNIHKAYIMNTDIVITKTADKEWTIPKDKLLITTTIVNNTENNISDFAITSVLSPGASFVDGSVKIGSQTFEEYNPITGFTPSVTIGANGGEMIMTYEIAIDDYLDADVITDMTKLGVQYGGQTFDLQSNELSITVLHNAVSLLKTANTNAVVSGDTLTYTIIISNSGTLTNTEMNFKDEIPQNTTFVENSVKIDGEAKEGYDPSAGFALKDLLPEEQIVVELSVTVK